MQRSFYKIFWRETKDYFFITFGIALYCLGVTVFMLPYGLTTGGVSGISAIIYYVTGLEIQYTYVAINIILLIAAIRLLGIKFCIKTIWGVASMTVLLWLFQRIMEAPIPFSDKHVLPKLIGPEAHFMACILGALFEGIGLSFCFEHNGSTGGTDIIAAVVRKYSNVTLGTVIMACDVVIISSCYFVFHDWFRVIYGFVMLFTSAITLDYVMRRRNQSVQFLIFSRNPLAISEAIIKMGHGVTLLSGEGCYTHSERKVILSIVRSAEVPSIQRLVKNIDPYSFVSMSEAHSVWGEGFDKMKVRENRGFKKREVLVCASNNVQKIERTQNLLGDNWEVRTMDQVGCDTRQDFYAAILTKTPHEKVGFLKRYFGFNAFFVDNEGKVTYLDGDYDVPVYEPKDFDSLEAFCDFLVKESQNPKPQKTWAQ